MNGDTADLLEQLLHEEEGTALDFKASQYPFSGADDRQKSELLKDILAFANSWRRSDAYILIGVREEHGGRSVVEGVTTHLADADLQQFVNTKVNRPIAFCYAVHALEGKEIGVIRVDLQDRPFYLKEDYGKLQASLVYVRRGSSTAIATPDEIAKMGNAPVQMEAQQPELSLCFVEKESLLPIGDEASVSVMSLELPNASEIPDYNPSTGMLSIAFPLANKRYYMEFAEYIDEQVGLREVLLQVENHGDVPALDVILNAKLDAADGLMRILDGHDRKSKPDPSLDMYVRPAISVWGPQRQFNVSRVGSDWLLEYQIGKIQPKAKAIIEGLFVGAYESRSSEVAVLLFADNLPEPTAFNLYLHVDVSKRGVSPEELTEFAHA